MIALNKVRATGNFHKAAKRDVRRTEGQASVADAGATSGEDEVAMTVLRLVVDELLEGLPESNRAMIELRIEGHEVAEIAGKVGRSKRSVERVLWNPAPASARSSTRSIEMMNSDQAGAAPGLGEVIEAFEEAKARDGRADPAAFLPLRDHPEYLAILCELVRVDMEYSWRGGAAERRRRLCRTLPRAVPRPRTGA